ncbi:hypothetical protein IAD21_06381 [Abditibacteriota bacterium]|nr:hypothetical protein IAD21_06381 [Abditibacteriota bacterium]
MNFSHSKWVRPSGLVAGVLLLGGGALLVKARRSNAGPPVYHLTVGQDLTYSITYSNSAHADFRSLLPDDKSGGSPPLMPSNLVQAVQSNVVGKWVMIVVAQNAKGSVWACHLEDAQISLHVGEEAVTEQAEAVRRDLERPLFARVTPQGKVLDVRFDNDTQSVSQGFARALLGASQFVVPTNPKNEAANWEATEDDTLGKYVARYETSPANSRVQGSKDGVDDASHAESGALFRKTKVRYLPGSTATTNEAPMAQTIKPDTNILARFDLRSGYLTSLRGSEKQSVSLAGQSVAHAQTDIVLKLKSQSSLDAKALEDLQTQNAQSEKAVEPVSLFVAPSADEVREASRKSTLGQETLGTLLSELAKHQKAGETENSELYLKFRALADLHPESCPFLGKLLAVVPAGSLSFRVLSESLAAVDSPEAQEAIVFAIQARPNDQEALLRLIPPMGMKENPSPSAQKVVGELAKSSRDFKVASTAQLALGAMARSLAKSSPARSVQIVDAILGQLEKAKSPGEIQQLLLMLGNTGSVHALPALQRYSRSESIPLRTTAVNSLRFINSPTAERLLLTTLSQDIHADMRLEAAQALGFRPMTDLAFQSQKAVLQSDQSASVRLTLLNNLYSARKDSPELKGIIGQLAAHDPSADVRRAATNIKNQNPDSG